ncbi:MAG: glycosyltransferase family 2 protein [Micropepsaceae bacterium]
MRRSKFAPQRAALISILIPVYNEEKNIRLAYDAVVEQFKKMGDRYSFEIVFTDNHSIDGTERELERLAGEDKRVKVLRFSRNFGFQRSILTAYRHARGDAAVQLDCDLQDPPEMIPKLLDAWEQGSDVVVGIRAKRPEGFFLSAGRRLFYWIVTAISDDNIVQNAGDFRLVDRSVIERLKTVNDAKPYTRGLISSLAANQTGIVYDRGARQFEKSKFPLRKLTSVAADGIINHSLLPLRLAGIAGFLIFSGSCLLTLYYFLAWLIGNQSWPPGFATTTILILISLGMNGMFIGILGEYVGRIYDQTRTRPLTIIARSLNFDDQPNTENNDDRIEHR